MWDSIIGNKKGVMRMCDEKILKAQEQIREILEKYQYNPENLISILQEVQGRFGYLSRENLVWIGRGLNISPAKVFGVATFYTQFRLNPIGKHLILLCQGTACHVNGSEKIQKVIEEELHIHEGETTKDGLFTLNNVACLGCCSLSPVMMIGEETYSSLTADKVKKILKNLAEGEGS